MNAPLLAAALSLSLAPAALAQDSAAVHSRMLQVAAELAQARTSGAPASVTAGLLAHYAELSERVGGDDPANAAWGSGPAPASAASTPANGPQFQNAPTCSGAGTQTFNFSGTGGVIPSTSVDSFTTQVSGFGAYLWDVNLTTGITHTACQDLDVTLISPAGTVVVITTDNGGINDNVFNGTIWDDSIPDPVTDRLYQNLVTASPLSPEGRLAAFRGEDPNGTWTLRVQDDAFSNAGSVGSWSLQLSALATAPTVSSNTFTRSPALPLADNATTFDSLVVSGAGTSIAEVELYLEIRHTSCQDLDIVLISPTGSQAVVSTDGGGSFDDVFRGTLFDVDAPTPVTDVLFTNLVAVPLASPEGGFDAFVGLNPNGSWQLRITDDNGTELGTLDRWDLTVRTVPAPTVPPPSGFFRLERTDHRLRPGCTDELHAARRGRHGFVVGRRPDDILRARRLRGSRRQAQVAFGPRDRHHDRQRLHRRRLQRHVVGRQRQRPDHRPLLHDQRARLAALARGAPDGLPRRHAQRQLGADGRG